MTIAADLFSFPKEYGLTERRMGPGDNMVSPAYTIQSAGSRLTGGSGALDIEGHLPPVPGTGRVPKKSGDRDSIIFGF